MRVVLYARGELKNFAALAEGCQVMGHTVTWQRPSQWKGEVLPCDAVVTDGIQRIAGQIMAAYQKKGVPVWIMEMPRLRDEDAYGLYLDTVHWVPRRGYRKAVTRGPFTGPRPQAVLVAGQVPNDVAHGMPAGAWDQWSRDTVKMAREKYDLPVIYRQHPVYEREIPADGFGADEVDSSPSIYDALKKVSLVICHNSTVGWNAIDAGIPVLFTATGKNEPGWKEYAGEKPLSREKRKEALSRVASTQWTLDEMRSGVASERMFGTVEELAVA